MTTYKDIKKELEKNSSLKQVKINEWFFKKQKGGYSENDIFCGIRVPQIREIIKKVNPIITFDEIEKLLCNKIHEYRLAAVIMLVNFYKKEKKSKEDILHFYSKNISYVNNWDIVDSSCHHIIGNYIYEIDYSYYNTLIDYANSDNLWLKRISLVTNYYLIKRGNFDIFFQNADIYLENSYRHDLLNKALGWMLREIWKVDSLASESYLIDNYDKIPRTAIRYAIEKMDKEKRRVFLKKEF